MSHIYLTSWPISLSDSLHAWMKCRETNGPFYCAEYLLQDQYTRVDIKDSSIKEFPIVLETRLNNTHDNMWINKLLLNFVV